MNAIELINKIKEVSISQEVVNSVYDGDVYTNWNSGEINYGSINIGLREITYDEQYVTYSFIFYYGDRLLQDDSNSNQIITDGINAIQSVINILNTIDFINIDGNIIYTPFVQKFSDYLGGVYAQVDITTDSPIGLCDLNDYVYIDDKDKLIEKLIKLINKYKAQDKELANLLQEILYKLNKEE